MPLTTMSKEDVLRYFGPNTMINPIQAEFLYDNIIGLPDFGRALDLGTGHGDSASLIALTKPNWIVYTFDGFGLYGSIQNAWNTEGSNEFNPRGVPYTINRWNQTGVKNVVQILGNTWDVPWELPADLIYIDADHSYEGVKRDVEKFSPFLKEGGVLGFHDYNDNYGVKRYIDDNMLNDWDISVKEWSCILRRKGERK